MALVVIGVCIGTAAALLLTRFIETFLYRIEPDDPATVVAVAAVLGLTTLLASYVPARRATLVNPVTALRTE